jgi:hypothetical protein
VKFNLKKAQMAKALRTVTDLVNAASAFPPPMVDLEAGPTGAILRCAQGPQITQVRLPDATVEAEGSVAVNIDALTSALNVSGDQISFSGEKNSLSFRCGRTTGSIPIVGEGQDVSETMAKLPKASIEVRALKAFLKASSLPGKSTVQDRTIHVDGKSFTLRAETTDTNRGASVTIDVKGSKIPGTTALVIPNKVLEAITKHMDTGRIGFDERTIVVQGPDVLVSFSQSSDAPMNIQEQIQSHTDQAECLGAFVLKTKGFKEALKDAQALLPKETGSLTLTLQQGVCTASAASRSGSASAEFDTESSTTKNQVTVGIDPGALRECLDLYTTTDTVTMSVYESMLVIDLQAADELLCEQRTVISVSDPAQVVKATAAPAKKQDIPPPAEPKAAKRKKYEDDEDDGE